MKKLLLCSLALLAIQPAFAMSSTSDESSDGSWNPEERKQVAIANARRRKNKAVVTQAGVSNPKAVQKLIAKDAPQPVATAAMPAGTALMPHEKQALDALNAKKSRCCCKGANRCTIL